MKFISDGTWFDKYTEVTILVECGTVYDKDGKPSLSVLASGLRHGELDAEMCDMEELIIVGNDYFFKLEGTMSNFICEKCSQTCYDTPRGYVTGCKHYPPDIAAVNYMYKRYLETRNALEELWLMDDFIPDALNNKIKTILYERPLREVYND